MNPAGLAVYNIGTGTPVGETPGTEPNPDCQSTSTSCSPDQLAAHDLWVWEQALLGAGAKIGTENTAGLIAPRACILFTAASGLPVSRTRTGLLTVIIQWRGLHESSDAVQPGETICGGEAAGTDKFRRQVVTNTYVVDEGEF